MDVVHAGRVLAGLALASATLLAAAQPRVVTVAVDDAHPPYTYAQDSQAAGLYVRLMGEAMRGLPGWRLRLVLRPWARALQESRQGRVDALLPPYREVDRDWMQLFAGPLHMEQVVLSCVTGVTIGPASRWPEGFSGLRVGTTRAYLLSHQLSAGFARELVRQLEYRDGRDALAALATGEIDCYGNDLKDIEHSYQAALADPRWAPRMPRRLEPPVVIASQNAWLGVSQRSLQLRPELATFVEALNARLAQMRASGELRRLMESPSPERRP
ncbi:ABC transporter substrate-binding protein [Pelomonas sp. KK5]|uniref:substrate-binding periplasmic protein n=1 Tax=Pelomonas sp. KK5 TaxID=1855730 RepID=UPI001E381807|nr:transporter substrate-binding domain-containing protein [Pelomonas sp. KK5]